jgi:hypothetical protein
MVTVTDAIIRAFLVGDPHALKMACGLRAWDGSPLTEFETTDPSAPRLTAADQRARAVRRQIVAELEARAGFTYSNLEDPDEDRARRAWWELTAVAEAVGITQTEWDPVLRRAGWEPAGPDETDPRLEAETARLAAELFPGEIERRVYPARGGAE